MVNCNSSESNLIDCNLCLYTNNEAELAENELQVVNKRDSETIGYIAQSSARMLATFRYRTGYVSYNEILEENKPVEFNSLSMKTIIAIIFFVTLILIFISCII